MIVQNADGIVIIGEDGIVRYANPAAETLFGTSAEDLIGGRFGFPVVSGKTTELDIARESASEAPVELATVDEEWHEERVYQVRTVQFIVVELRVMETEWQGETAFVVTLRDITGGKRAERERTAVTSISIAINRDLDLPGICERLADHLMRILPYDRLEVRVVRRNGGLPQIVYWRGLPVSGADIGDVLPSREVDAGGQNTVLCTGRPNDQRPGARLP